MQFKQPSWVWIFTSLSSCEQMSTDLNMRVVSPVGMHLEEVQIEHTFIMGKKTIINLINNNKHNKIINTTYNVTNSTQ